MEQILPGVWKTTLGEPECLSPVHLRNCPPATERLAQLPASEIPAIAATIQGHATSRGYELTLALDADEQIYGFGLQLQSLNQRGRKRTLRVNSDPRADLGDSHAPVPFYVSTHGYGILIDTARYLTVYSGVTSKRCVADAVAAGRQTRAVDGGTAGSVEALYAAHQRVHSADMLIEIPFAQGVDVYIFAGPSLTEAVQRYNLFSGGGCLPPRWGLGVWYRCHHQFTQTEAESLADAIRTDGVPCDVFGLEPSWQSHAYSCTYDWSSNYPDPAGLIERMASLHLKVNLWTHAFVDAASPLYTPLVPLAGDYLVWDGLIPDFTLPATRDAYADFYEQTHVTLGISGYKLDECDNSDFITTPWSYPELTRFPSGLDGEQYHSLMGIHFQESIHRIFRRRNQRAYHEARSSQALAAPYPFVLYSDLYDHRDFLRGLVTAGFSGLLWCPEVRHADSEEDLLRRLQSVIFSPQALVNGWYIRHAPWRQWQTAENNAGAFLPNAEELTARVRDIFALRMQLIPYLYAAFYRYYAEGIPPFRALVMDYPHDAQAQQVDDAWLVGDRLLVAPVIAGMSAREIYLPEGGWRDFWTGEWFAGGQVLHRAVPLTSIPVFVKDGAVLPLATPTLHTDDVESMKLVVRVYGDGYLPATLIEDDGLTYGYEEGELNRVSLTWDATQQTGQVTRTGTLACPQYSAVAWERIGE